MRTYGITVDDFTLGQRVELHPGCDLWMRGAQYGRVAKIDRKAGLIHVRMDHPQVRGLQRLRPDILSYNEEARS